MYTLIWNVILSILISQIDFCTHNWNFFPNLNFLPQLHSAHMKIHDLFWPDLLKSHPPDQQKSVICGKWAKISHDFLCMERDQSQFLGFLPTVYYGSEFGISKLTRLHFKWVIISFIQVRSVLRPGKNRQRSISTMILQSVVTVEFSKVSIYFTQ